MRKETFYIPLFVVLMLSATMVGCSSKQRTAEVIERNTTTTIERPVSQEKQTTTTTTVVPVTQQKRTTTTTIEH